MSELKSNTKEYFKGDSEFLIMENDRLSETITSLRSELERVREALKKIASFGVIGVSNYPEDDAVQMFKIAEKALLPAAPEEG